MSKYNRTVSIPIESLSKEEIATAIKEWAEGDESLESFLWACYKNSIKTTGCHSNGNDFYVGIEYDESKTDIYVKLMDAVLTMKRTQIHLNPNCGNPFSGPNWDKPNLLLGSAPNYQDDNLTSNPLARLTQAINEETSTLIIIDSQPLITLNEFFKGKLTGLCFRIIRTPEDEYLFSIECPTIENSGLYNYLCNNLFPLGFTLKTFVEGPHRNWIYSSKDQQEFNKMILESTSKLIKNFSLTIPSSMDEVNSFNLKAYIAKKQMSEEEFNKWLEEKRIERQGLSRSK